MNVSAIERFDVLGVPISATSLDLANQAIAEWSEDRIGRFVFIRDVHGVMQAQRDPNLLDLHQRASMVTPDGMPLVWLGRLAGKTISRTCGADLMERVLADSAQSGIRHYFYGGKPGVAEKLLAKFTRKYPGLNVVGIRTPSFEMPDEAELHSIANLLNESRAQVVWIGISTPKQEVLMSQLAPLVTCTLVGVGAAFDFHAGTVTRAPRFMRSAGLEWSWRLAQEPRRLWYRYLVLAPLFVLKVFASTIRKGQ